MNETITLYESIPPEQRQAAAEELHEKILLDTQRVTLALCELCKSLKTMRDTKLYIDLGYESFDAYVEARTDFKARQAYTYIAAYEKLGKPFLQSNANLGITKLSLLTEVSAVDREAFAEENDLAGMSVREVKALLEEKKQFGEQVSLLTVQVESLKEHLAAALPEERAEDLRRELEAAGEESERLRRELKDLKERPVEVAVAEPSAGEIEKIRAEAKKEFDEEQKKLLKEEREKMAAKAKKDAEKEIAAAREEAAVLAKKDIEAALERVEREKAEAIARADKLAKELEVSADADFIAANHFFQEWDEYFAKLMDVIEKIRAGDADKAAKLQRAVGKRLELMAGQVAG